MSRPKIYVGKWFPMFWAVFSAVVVTSVFISVGFHWQFGFTVIAVISTSFSTFLCAWVGIKMLNSLQYRWPIAALMGLIFGTFAFVLTVLLTALITTLFIEEMREFENFIDGMTSIAIMGFIMGGFLGPFMGMMTGLELSSKLKRYSKYKSSGLKPL